jgi:hypothetical protein
LPELLKRSTLADQDIEVRPESLHVRLLICRKVPTVNGGRHGRGRRYPILHALRRVENAYRDYDDE